MYMDDLRFALRLWRKSPGTAAVVLLSLTLGIGANATIFTFVKELFVPAMPVADASRLVMVYCLRRVGSAPGCWWCSVRSRCC